MSIMYIMKIAAKEISSYSASPNLYMYLNVCGNTSINGFPCQTLCIDLPKYYMCKLIWQILTDVTFATTYVLTLLMTAAVGIDVCYTSCIANSHAVLQYNARHTHANVISLTAYYRDLKMLLRETGCIHQYSENPSKSSCGFHRKKKLNM